MINNINVFTDGGARGNPGPSAIGVYIVKEDGKKLAGFGKKIGIATNNIAEYKAVLEALSFLNENKKNLKQYTTINFFLDSQLVCSQLLGIFKVKNANLKSLLFSVREKEAELKMKILYKHIPREENTKADSLVNDALDDKI